jgi:hypothetical protein
MSIDNLKSNRITEESILQLDNLLLQNNGYNDDVKSANHVLPRTIGGEAIDHVS